jgi:hypothetical protein
LYSRQIAFVNLFCFLFNTCTRCKNPGTSKWTHVLSASRMSGIHTVFTARREQTGSTASILTVSAKTVCNACKDQMSARDLGALVLFAGANIRYVTASYQGNWKYNINIRYAIVPHGGEPILFETAGSDLHCAEIDLPWMEGRINPAITWQWAEGAVPVMAGRMAQSVVDVLEAHGLRKERVGIDNFDWPALKAFQECGLNITDA